MFQRRESPFVFTNGAVSLDGKLALENRSIIQFSSAQDRRSVFQLRARADAVLCGAETVETFAIDLEAGSAAFRKKRKRSGLAPEPLRILVSQGGNIDPGAKIFHKPVSPVILITTKTAAKQCAAKLRGLATVKGFGQEGVDFVRAFRWLHAEWRVERLLCEGGGETNAALIRAGVVDEMHVTVCPLVLCGRKAMTLCDGEGFPSLKVATRLKLKSVKKIRDELFLTYGVLSRRTEASRRAR
jgi:5-amino-6-(5-phosphoribosylamino)uracil reductase